MTQEWKAIGAGFLGGTVVGLGFVTLFVEAPAWSMLMIILSTGALSAFIVLIAELVRLRNTPPTRPKRNKLLSSDYDQFRNGSSE